MANRYGESQDNIKLKVIRFIRERTKFSTRQIADSFKTFNNPSYYVGTDLVDKGDVKLENKVSLSVGSGVSEKLLSR